MFLNGEQRAGASTEAFPAKTERNAARLDHHESICPRLELESHVPDTVPSNCPLDWPLDGAEERVGTR